MKLNRVLVVAFFATVVCCAVSGEKSFAANFNARESVNLLRRIEPRMTLSQAKNVMPRNTIYGWDGQTQLGNWTWQVRHFRGFSRGAKIEGVLVFANDRAKYIALRSVKSEAERERLDKDARSWRAGDIVHSVTMFLGDERKVETVSAINRDTQLFVSRISKLLGRPARKYYDTPGGGPGDGGWRADWKLSHHRMVYGAETIALLDSASRPSLQLIFDYSQLYRA